MAKRIELLLLKSIENLGIVGDIVRVRAGYARNYLLPHRFAEAPTERKIESLREERTAALAELAKLRQAREELIERMKEVRIELKRSCNDQGVLYGSVTQRDIADGLQEAGYDVGLRSIRLSQPIRRIGEYHVPIQFEKDLRTEVLLNVESDRSLQEEEKKPEQPSTEEREMHYSDHDDNSNDERPRRKGGFKKSRKKEKPRKENRAAYTPLTPRDKG